MGSRRPVLLASNATVPLYERLCRRYERTAADSCPNATVPSIVGGQLGQLGADGSVNESETLVDLSGSLVLGYLQGEMEFGDEQPTGVSEHPLLPGGQVGSPLAQRQVPDDLGRLVHVTGFEHRRVVLEPTRPVVRRPHLLGEHSQYVFGFFTVDDLPHTDLAELVDRDPNDKAVVGLLKHEIVTTLAHDGDGLTAFDNRRAVVRVDNLITDVEGQNTPREKGETGQG